LLWLLNRGAETLQTPFGGSYSEVQPSPRARKQNKPPLQSTWAAACHRRLPDMKRLFCLAAALALHSNPGVAALPDLHANVTGAVQALPCILTDAKSTSGDGKTENVTNASLFADFALAPEEYALVLSFTDSALEFVPLSASSTKPKVKVFAFGLNALANGGSQAKAIIVADEAAARAPAIEKATLHMIGQVTLTGTLAVAANLAGQQFRAAIYAVANGPAPLDGSPLSLRLATGKVFTQKP
jgi:hypothetical protein